MPDNRKHFNFLCVVFLLCLVYTTAFSLIELLFELLLWLLLKIPFARFLYGISTFSPLLASAVISYILLKSMAERLLNQAQAEKAYIIVGIVIIIFGLLWCFSFFNEGFGFDVSKGILQIISGIILILRRKHYDE